MIDETRLLHVSADNPLMGWEPADTYNDLATALQTEYRPHGATERHLVEELALTIWRRRRLRIAEQIELLKAIPVPGRGEAQDFIERQACKLAGNSVRGFDATELLCKSDADLEEERSALASHTDACESALSHLDTGRKKNYQQAIKVLCRAGWDWTEDASWQDDGKALASSIREHLRELNTRLTILQNVRLLRSLSTACSYAGANMLQLMKLDMALSKKMESTLAMLLKLRSLRASASENAPA